MPVFGIHEVSLVLGFKFTQVKLTDMKGSISTNTTES